MSIAIFRSGKTWVAAAAIALVAGGAWGVVSLSRNHGPAVPKDLTVDALQAKAAEDPGKLFDQLHETMQRTDLTEAQRQAIHENVRKAMEVQMDKRMNEYFNASPAEKNAVLDRHLAEMQARMKDMEKRRAQMGDAWRGPGGPPPGASGANAGPRAAGGSPPAAGQAAGSGAGERRAGDPGRGPRGEPSREQRKAFTENRDPDKSARHMAYFTAMRQRAEAKGIQMPFGPGHGPR